MARTEQGWWRLAAYLAMANIAWMLAMLIAERATFKRAETSGLCLGLESEILALELAPSKQCVNAVLMSGVPCANVSALKLHLVLDAVFILLYGALLYSVGSLALAGTPSRLGRWILIGLVVGACVADAVEDWGLWRIATTITWDGATLTVRGRALVKWAVFFLAVGYISWLWRRTPLAMAPWVRQSLAGLAAVSALIGLVGLFWAPAIGWSFAPMVAWLVTLIVAARRRLGRAVDVDGAGGAAP